ncbi:MAG: hypothetical protein ABJB74_10180 [Gemmatimonas sp.]
MTDIAREAAFHRAALLLGIESGADVVQWADNLIVDHAHVPKEILELSTVPPYDLSELRHALQPLAAHEDALMLRALFDRVRQDALSGTRTLKDTVTVLAQARSFLALPLEYFTNIDTLQDDHMLAMVGIGASTASVESQVSTWLSQFEGNENEFHSECARA